MQPLEKSQHPDKSTDENSLGENRTTGVMASLSSPIPSVDADSRETDDLCQATGRLTVAETQNNEGTDSPSDMSMLEVLPQKARPAFNLICSYLRTNEEGVDLANFSVASPYFRAEVIEYMGIEGNRPGFECANLTNSEDGLRVDLQIFAANLPFYNFSNLDWGRFSRVMEDDIPILRVNLTGPNDAVIEQVSDLLSSSINIVEAGSHGHAPLSTANLILAEKILRKSFIGELFLDVQNLNETTAPLILSMTSHTEKIGFSRSNESQVADPAMFFLHFIQQLDSLPLSFIALGDLSDSSSFFGLPNSFWEIFFNEKLSNRSVKWVEEGFVGEKVTKAPIDWSDTEIKILEWENARTN